MQTYHVCIWFSINFVFYLFFQFIRISSSSYSDQSFWSLFTRPLFPPIFLFSNRYSAFFHPKFKSFIYLMISEWNLVWQLKHIETVWSAHSFAITKTRHCLFNMDFVCTNFQFHGIIGFHMATLVYNDKPLHITQNNNRNSESVRFTHMRTRAYFSQIHNISD